MARLQKWSIIYVISRSSINMQLIDEANRSRLTHLYNNEWCNNFISWLQAISKTQTLFSAIVYDTDNPLWWLNLLLTDSKLKFRFNTWFNGKYKYRRVKINCPRIFWQCTQRIRRNLNIKRNYASPASIDSRVNRKCNMAFQIRIAFYCLYWLPAPFLGNRPRLDTAFFGSTIRWRQWQYLGGYATVWNKKRTC